MFGLTLSEFVVLCVGLFAVLFGIAKVGKYVLQSFHDQNVQPEIAKLTLAMALQTTAMTAQTTAITALTEALKKSDHDNSEAFAGIREILDAHDDTLSDHAVDIGILKGKAKITAKKRPTRRKTT